jgi:DNA-binding response OmpR family regulator
MMKILLLVFVVEGKNGPSSSISSTVEGAGFRVRVFHAGTSALQAAQDQTPTLIIFDVPLPQIDGGDLFRSLHLHFAQKD